MRAALPALVVLTLPTTVSAQLMTKLAPATVQAFERYVAANEPKLLEAARTPQRLPWLGENAAAEVRKGDLVVRSYTGKDGQAVPEGLVHDWVGGMFFPGTTLERTVSVLQDFARHKEWYPEIINSRLIARNGGDARGFWVMLKKKVIMVVLQAEIDSRFEQASPGHGVLISRTGPVLEVADFGKPSEHAYPQGEGHGFLWRFNGYWTLHAADGGVYAECRVVSLSRDVPSGLGWIVNPFIRSMPRESLEATLNHTRNALKGTR